VRLRIGALASIIEDSLKFCWEITVQGTPLQGAELLVNIVPVQAHCAACGKDGELASLQSFRCPHCGEPVTDLRQGRELEIESIEIDEIDEIDDIAEIDEAHQKAGLAQVSLSSKVEESE
jgi:hydrogenase nickel incorporation protein HypA/HybF